LQNNADEKNNLLIMLMTAITPRQ